MALTDVIVRATMALATELNCAADKGTGWVGKVMEVVLGEVAGMDI